MDEAGKFNAITDVPGILVGQVERVDLPYLTGTTVVYAPGTAVAGVDVRGGAPGTRETELLDPVNSNAGVNAIVLTGGSAYGLDTAGGVMEWLEERGEGVRVGPGERDVVPIVPTVVLFDLGRGGDFRARPEREWGQAAVEAANGGEVAQGNRGAGAGARAGVLRGGVGTASMRLADGSMVGALVVVNAAGSTVDAQGNLLGSRYGFPGEFDHVRTPVETGQEQVLGRLASGPAPAGASQAGPAGAGVRPADPATAGASQAGPAGVGVSPAGMGADPATAGAGAVGPFGAGDVGSGCTHSASAGVDQVGSSGVGAREASASWESSASVEAGAVGPFGAGDAGSGRTDSASAGARYVGSSGAGVAERGSGREDSTAGVGQVGVGQVGVGQAGVGQAGVGQAGVGQTGVGQAGVDGGGVEGSRVLQGTVPGGVGGVGVSVMNTVIAVVATDVPLDKAAAKRMAMVAHDGLARAVDPIHTLVDGDAIFALSTGTGERLSVTDPAALWRLEAVYAAGARTLARAIAHGMLAAESVETPAGRVLSYRDAYPSAVGD